MNTSIERWIDDLSEADLPSQRAAAEALASMAEEARQAAIPLVRACGSEDSDLRAWSVAALEQLGPPVTSDVNALAKLIGGENETSDYWAITLIGRGASELCPEQTEITTVLTAALESSPYQIVRQRAAWALGRLGSKTAAVRQALQRATDSTDARLVRLAQAALEKGTKGTTTTCR
jgi:HEAT repeat protein